MGVQASRLQTPSDSDDVDMEDAPPPMTQVEPATSLKRTRTDQIVEPTAQSSSDEEVTPIPSKKAKQLHLQEPGKQTAFFDAKDSPPHKTDKLEPSPISVRARIQETLHQLGENDRDRNRHSDSSDLDIIDVSVQCLFAPACLIV